MGSNYDFTYTQGTTYKGVQFTYAINGVPVDFTGSQIKIDFRAYKDKNGPVVQHLEIGEGITLGALGIFSIDSQVFQNFSGDTKYGYDVQIFLANGTYRNDIHGTVSIVGAYTHG